MIRRGTIVALTAGLLAVAPTAAMADQKPAKSVVSYSKFRLAALNGNFGKGNFGKTKGWGKGWQGPKWGQGPDHHGPGWGGNKSNGC
jgi:hypothetical protein